MAARSTGRPRQKSMKNRPQKGYGRQAAGDLGAMLHAEMERCPTAESLHERVIEPFLSALVSTCNARGYVLNVYGENCNLSVTPESHAEQIYRLVDAYMDEADLV